MSVNPLSWDRLIQRWPTFSIQLIFAVTPRFLHEARVLWPANEQQNPLQTRFSVASPRGMYYSDLIDLDILVDTVLGRNQDPRCMEILRWMSECDHARSGGMPSAEANTIISRGRDRNRY